MSKKLLQICPNCLAAIPADAPGGSCPKCLLNAGFETQDLPGEGRSGAQRVVPPLDEIARHFPQLEILEMLGAGGMGVVYKARQISLDRPIALKILPLSSGHDPAFAERFTREARALAKLSHPNIVGIHDFGQTGGYYYFLMEFVDGVNLRQMLRASRLSPREALAIVPQVCDALQYAHDQGIVHRDIKPENLLVDREGRVHIADFGLAKLVGAVPDVQLTQSQHVMGTPHYMAPEQLEKPLAVDHRADIYSLGVVLYEMLTGELPLGRFAPPSAKVQVDVRLDEVVLRTLEKEPERRYQQASEVKGDVETLGGIRFKDLPPGMRTMLGGEFVSRTRIGSWPLVHVAFGMDPQTGRSRHARGIVAIASGRATGVIALGSMATGIFAFGGIAVGLVALGGVGVGLLTFAGFGLGLVFCYAGLALGALSYGGLAVGWGAMGGMAVGVHALGGMAAGTHANNRVAEAFLEQWSFLMSWKVFVLAMILFLTAQMAQIVAWLWIRGRQADPGYPLSRRPVCDPEAQVAWPSKALVLAALLNWLALFVFAAFAFYFRTRTSDELRAVAPVVIVVLMAGSGLILFGALKMQRLESLAWARMAAVLAMFIGPGYFIGWPAGIWSLAVLARPDVKRAFTQRRAGSQTSR